MSPVTHALTGWCLAEAFPGLRMRDRAIVFVSAVAPDLDGFGILPELLTRNSSDPLLWWTDYHHVLAHNLLFAIVMMSIAAMISTKRVALLAFVAVHLHLIADLAGSRGPDGYQWPIPYLTPFSDIAFSWSGQWALNAWQNMAITIVLLATTIVLAWSRGYSPAGLFSARADAALITVLRQRFPRREA